MTPTQGQAPVSRQIISGTPLPLPLLAAAKATISEYSFAMLHDTIREGTRYVRYEGTRGYTSLNTLFAPRAPNLSAKCRFCQSKIV